MSVTIYRQGCGTHLGLLIHQANGEHPCSECLHREDVRRLQHEGIPHRLPPAHKYLPVTDAEAEHNRAVLLEAVYGRKP